MKFQLFEFKKVKAISTITGNFFIYALLYNTHVSKVSLSLCVIRSEPATVGRR